MAVVGDVFGLNAVYDRQVKNVEENSLDNWPEIGISPLRGYLAGGRSGASPNTSTCTIQRIDYSSDTSTVIQSSMSRKRDQLGNWTNPSYAWFQGDRSSGLSSQERFDYSNETISQPGVNVPSVSGWASFGTVQTPSYGYMAGGVGISVRSKIARFDLSTESFLEKGNLPQYNSGLSGVYNSNYGYFGGGYYPPLTPDYICVINRLDFSSDTGASPITTSQSNRFHLSQFARSKSTLQDSSYGYWAGGYDVSSPFFNDKISRFAFATETFGPPTTHPIGLAWKSLPAGRYDHSSASSSTHGYFVGGIDILNPYSSVIDKMDLSTGTFASPAGSLPFPINMATLTDSVITNTFRSFGRPYVNKTAGYSDYKYNFPTSTWTTVAGGNPGYRTYAVANNSHAYVSREPSNFLDKFDFVSETNTTSFPYPSPANIRMTGFANKNYGYFTGGNGDPAAPTIDEKIRRIEFETDSALELSEQLPLGRESHGTIYNENYGYLCGGRLPDTSQVQRMDFSNETMSTLPPSSNLPHGAALVHLGYANSNQAGYFCGGFSRSTIFRLDFSTENASSPGNLGNFSREGYAMGGEYEGYFGGGYQPGLPDMKKLDYSSDTLSNTGSNPPVSIRYSATFNNGL
jgi:hypothetical protein